jgi:KDO2-lipid IV(A) lauroyltransferase
MGAEFCHLATVTRENVARYVRIEDRGAWEKVMALADERGAVILTGHFGNWELFAYAHALLGRPVTLVHRPMNNPLVDDAIMAARMRAGTRSLAKKAAARDVLRALRDKALVVIPADQNQRRDYGVFVDFFGKPACTTPGPARLAMLTGAPVIPAFLVREDESDRHRIVLLPAVEMQRSNSREADIVANTQRCTAVIEEMIRRHPDHWIWFHKRWKTRPPGEPRLYPR